MRRVTRTDPERGIARALLACACLPLLVTAALLVVLLLETAQLLRHAPPLELLLGAAWAPAAGGQAGLLPLAAGTLLVALVALAVALPAGLLSAVYLSEYAPHAVRRAVAPLFVLLAAVPTVVYGYFALRFVTPLLQRVLPGLADGNALSPGIVAGIMILPMVTALAVDALQGVPHGLREAARALGATRAQAVLQVVLPAAGAGIAAAVVLAAARAVGETMIVAVAAGGEARLTANPLGPVETLAAYIVHAARGEAAPGARDGQAIFAVGLLLFAGTFGLNLLGHRLRRRGGEAPR